MAHQLEVKPIHYCFDPAGGDCFCTGDCFAVAAGFTSAAGAAGAAWPKFTEIPNRRHCPLTGAYISSKLTWVGTEARDIAPGPERSKALTKADRLRHAPE